MGTVEINVQISNFISGKCVWL